MSQFVVVDTDVASYLFKNSHPVRSRRRLGLGASGRYV
jgi:hypothetical protein